MLHHVIMSDELYLAACGPWADDRPWWTRWTADEDKAKKFFSKDEARDVAREVDGVVYPRMS